MAWKSAQKVFKHWKILRGDKVMVMTGKDRGLTGTVTEVLRDKNKAIVQGLNLMKKHVRPPPGGDKSQGGIVTFEAPLHIAKLSLLDPVTGQPCRVGFKYTEDGTKVRVSRGSAASGQIIARPEILKERRRERSTEAGALDTPKAEAHQMTYEHGKMSEEVGLPPIKKVNGRWQLDIASMGPLVPLQPKRVFSPAEGVRKQTGPSQALSSEGGSAA